MKTILILTLLSAFRIYSAEIEMHDIEQYGKTNDDTVTGGSLELRGIYITKGGIVTHIFVIKYEGQRQLYLKIDGKRSYAKGVVKTKLMEIPEETIAGGVGESELVMVAREYGIEQRLVDSMMFGNILAK